MADVGENILSCVQSSKLGSFKGGAHGRASPVKVSFADAFGLGYIEQGPPVPVPLTACRCAWGPRYAVAHPERGWVVKSTILAAALITASCTCAYVQFADMHPAVAAGSANQVSTPSPAEASRPQTAGIVALMIWLHGPGSPLVLTQRIRMLAVLPPSSLLNLMSSGVRVLKATKR